MYTKKLGKTIAKIQKGGHRDKGTKSEIRVKSYCRLNLLRASTFNFKRLDILYDSIRHPSKKLLSFELAQSFNIQFRASRYITGLNQSSD